VTQIIGCETALFWRITRGPRCGLVHSPFYPGPGLGVSISQRRRSFDMAHGGASGRVLPKLRTKDAAAAAATATATATASVEGH
jgi:hypothetical protein